MPTRAALHDASARRHVCKSSLFRLSKNDTFPALKEKARSTLYLRFSPMRIEFWKQPEQLSKTTLSYGHTLNVLTLGIVIA